MRWRGLIKVTSILSIGAIVIAMLLGIEWAVIVTSLIALYAYLGEFTALWRAGAIPEDALDVYEKNKLERIKNLVVQRVKDVTSEDVSNIRLYIVPSDDINAMAYGTKSISFTKGAIESCDEMTLCALLGHEVSHIIFWDAILNRIVFGYITFIILSLMLISFVSISLIWIVFVILALCGICRGFISVYLTSGLSRGLKALFEIIQHGALFVYQAIMAAVSRSFEYRADQLPVDIGLGNQLAYFLNRFATSQRYQIKSLSEILYASHPAAYSRVQKINERQLKNSKNTTKP